MSAVKYDSKKVAYNNTISGLTGITLQEVIDELQAEKEPSNPNILTTASIGVTVQPYNANISTVNQGLTTTSNPTFANLTISSLSTSSINFPKTVGTALKIDGEYGWEDIIGAIVIRGSSGTDPAWTQYNGVISQYRCNALDDAVTLTFHLPHDYVPGTDLYAHVHWSFNVGSITQDVTWEFASTYAKGHNQGAFSTIKTTSVTQTSSTEQYQHMIAETVISSAGGSATLFDRAIFEVDGLLLIRVKYAARSGGTTPPFIHQVDLHYQSTGLPTKNKAPDFYG